MWWSVQAGMRAITLQEGPDLDAQFEELKGTRPAWALLYGVQGAPFMRITNVLRRLYVDLPVFGATSFQGVFTQGGFVRAPTLLVADEADQISPSFVLEATSANRARERAHAACKEIEQRLGKRPNMLLLHATPGFEEQILSGVRDAFGTDVPVYGGSAADDALDGKWQVFANRAVCSEGFLLLGLASERAPSGGFLGGYLATKHTGKLTRVHGRIVYEINGLPAAEVYNAWSDGAISAEVEKGGNVLSKTNLLPLGRTVGAGHGMPRRLLAHPRAVVPGEKGLEFFAEFSRGDEVTLMISTRGPLISRVRRAVQRARGSGRETPRGALLIYCAGCLGMMLDQADHIAKEFAAELPAVPWVGIATFGEQGTFFEQGESRHGNLMCSAVLF
jgi:hypothetical protein